MSNIIKTILLICLLGSSFAQKKLPVQETTDCTWYCERIKAWIKYGDEYENTFGFVSPIQPKWISYYTKLLSKCMAVGTLPNGETCGLKVLPKPVLIACPPGKVFKDGKCHNQCPKGFELNDGFCHKKEKICPVGQKLVNGKCVSGDCPKGCTWNGSVCLKKCPKGTVNKNNFCVDKCQKDEIMVNDNCRKVNPCKPSQIKVSGVCKNRCKKDETWKSGKCIKKNPCKIGEVLQKDGKCQKVCPNSQKLVKGACITPVKPCKKTEIRKNSICVKACPQGTHLVNNACVKTCNKSEVLLNNKCITPCPKGTHRVDGTCQKVCKKDEIWRNGKCAKKNPCKKPEILVKGKCTIVCPKGSRPFNGHCVKIIVCKNDEILKNGKCVKVCNKGEKLVNNTCQKVCPIGTVLVNGNCIKVCKEGETLNDNGKCVDVKPNCFTKAQCQERYTRMIKAKKEELVKTQKNLENAKNAPKMPVGVPPIPSFKRNLQAIVKPAAQNNPFDMIKMNLSSKIIRIQAQIHNYGGLLKKCNKKDCQKGYTCDKGTCKKPGKKITCNPPSKLIYGKCVKTIPNKCTPPAVLQADGSCVNTTIITVVTNCPKGFIKQGKICVKTVGMKCSPGFILDSKGNCVKKVVVESDCPTGYKKDGNTCVRSETECPTGYVNDPIDGCVQDVEENCPEGFSKTSSGNCAKQIIIQVKPNCPEGSKRSKRSGRCIRVAKGKCPIGTKRDKKTGKCLKPLLLFQTQNVQLIPKKVKKENVLKTQNAPNISKNKRMDLANRSKLSQFPYLNVQKDLKRWEKSVFKKLVLSVKKTQPLILKLKNARNILKN